MSLLSNNLPLKYYFIQLPPKSLKIWRCRQKIKNQYVSSHVKSLRSQFCRFFFRIVIRPDRFLLKSHEMKEFFVCIFVFWEPWTVLWSDEDYGKVSFEMKAYHFRTTRHFSVLTMNPLKGNWPSWSTLTLGGNVQHPLVQHFSESLVRSFLFQGLLGPVLLMLALVTLGILGHFLADPRYVLRYVSVNAWKLRMGAFYSPTHDSTHEPSFFVSWILAEQRTTRITLNP